MLYLRNMAKKTDTQGRTHVSVPVRVPVDLDNRITEASSTTRLAKQDVMRLSMERGLDILVAQLTGTAQP